MRCAHLLVAALALSAVAHSHAAVPTEKQVEGVLMDFIKYLSQPDPALPANKRRLLTTGGIQNVQAFFEDILGGGWRTLLPSRWANATFDWTHLGDFEYGSNLGDFLERHDGLANITSMHDLAHKIDKVEEHFCEPESFTPSAKVPATCSGPTVTIALVPKVCILEAKDKQILCDPAKLVLRKTPGSCVHKHKSASAWAGKECKLSGSAGYSDEKVIGGGEKSIPLIDIDIGYEASNVRKL